MVATEAPTSGFPRARMLEGLVIPAVPLALRADRTLDPIRQRALIRYYLAAGVGGVAVGVHSTQFAIREVPGLLERVLELAVETVAADSRGAGPIVKIAGICGGTEQAVVEAELAARIGYDAGLVSLAALSGADMPTLLAHCRRIADVLPIVGFYLQSAVGGGRLPYAFWRAFAEIENAVAIKIAPFNRYHTLDVVRAIVDAGRTRDIALYTGNDDNIVVDLLTPFSFSDNAAPVFIRGGLLGHWCVWTRTAVDLFAEIRALRLRMEGGEDVAIPSALLRRGVQVTDANAAFFDVANGFRGCIPGLHEVLRRQGLFEGTWCLDPDEVLSPGQAAEIDRVYAAYPDLNDDHFIAAHRDRWLSDR